MKFAPSAAISACNSFNANPVLGLLRDPRGAKVRPRSIVTDFGDIDEHDDFDDVSDDLGQLLLPFQDFSQNSADAIPSSGTTFRPVENLVDLIWRSTLKSADLTPLLSSGPKIVIITTPSEAWTDLIQDLLGGDTRNVIIVGLAKSNEPELLRSAIRRAASVIVVVHTIDFVPKAVRASADCVIALSVVTAEIVAELVEIATGDRPTLQHVERLCDAAFLEPTELAALVRPGRSAEFTITAIARATTRSASTGNHLLPDLATTRAFGQAGAWGRQLAQDLRAWRQGEIIWNDVDRGVVIWGPPGTGKTVFAKALAAHCGIPIVVSSISELFASSSGDLGGVIKAVRKVFAEAASHTSSILFFDEIDALPSRDGIDSSRRSWWGTVIADFLTMLDGAVSSREGVITIAATNLIDAVDPALMRPGRLERRIFLGPPDAAGLVDVLRLHLRGDLEGADLQPLCDRVAGMTAAQAMIWVREARRLARYAGRPLELADLRSIIGIDNGASPKMRSRLAIHEAGHAVIAHKIGWCVERVAIAPDGMSGGSMSSTVPADWEPTNVNIRNEIQVHLAGRAAEELLLGEPSAGAGGGEDSDLAKATRRAIQIEMGCGLGSRLSVFVADEVTTTKMAYSDRAMRRKVERLLRRLYALTLADLTSEKDRIMALAQRLCETDQIIGEELGSYLM